MTKSKLFIGIVISFSIGIAVASSCHFPIVYVYGALGILIAAFAIAVVARYKLVAVAALFLVCAIVGYWRAFIQIVPNEYDSMLGQTQEMEGHIVEDIDIRTDKQLVTFLPQAHTQRLLITGSLFQNYFYGDWVVVTGKITEPKPSPDFDYGAYLERYNIYGLMQYPKVIILRQHQQNWVVEKLLRLKYAFTGRLARLYAEPENSLLLGILIGVKKTLPQSIVDNFNATGTSHIIAISGFNITILINSLAWLSYVAGRKKSFWISLGIIVGFVILTGASASIVRAGVMGVLLLVSKTIGRQYRIASALFFAGFVMLMLNPKILYVDVGFQLSFAATLGIIYFVPQLEKLTAQWPAYFGAKTMMLSTMSAIIATSPLLIYNFGRLSLIAPLVNMLVLPMVPLTMLLGFLSVLPFVGPGFAFSTHFLLHYILNTTMYFAHIPYANVPVHISSWYYAVLMGAVGLLYVVVSYYAARVPPKAI